MKKITALLLGAVLMLLLAACANTRETPSAQNDKPSAAQEKRDDAPPEISAEIENFNQYETVFIGFPKMQYCL